MKIIPGPQAKNCYPPLENSDEVRAYLTGLEAGERVVECGSSALTGRCGTVYIKEATSNTERAVCVMWDKLPGESGQMGSTVTGGARRLRDAGTFAHLDTPDPKPEFSALYGKDGMTPDVEPEFSDGCDKDGFPGGCVRMGHTPENCPGFQVGDTVRFTDKHQAAGDEGVIVAFEMWLNDNETVPWDGCGIPPAYAGDFVLPNAPRYLIRLTKLGTSMVDSPVSVNSWRERCRQYPHSYPWVWDRDIELVSRPEIKVLNDSGHLGSTLGLDRPAELTCISDSEAGARKAIADMKAANGLALRMPDRKPGDKIRFQCREVSETKVADEIEIGFTYWMTTLFGVAEAKVVEIDSAAGKATVASGDVRGILRRKDDGWYDQHTIYNPDAIMKAQFTD